MVTSEVIKEKEREGEEQSAIPHGAYRIKKKKSFAL
jgi:hypothetical protein